MIAVITQEANANPTMALPFLDTILVLQIPEKKMTQKTIMFGMLAPTHELRAVNGHWHENTNVQEHICKLKIKQKGNKKECKTNNSNRRRQEKQNMEHFPKCRIMTAS